MKSIIVYGSCYGSSKRYAEALSAKTGAEAVEFSRFDKKITYDTLIYIGGLYAGG